MDDSDPPKPEERRPFQFSLRTLLIAVLVLSVFFGWLGSRLRRAARNREAAAEVRKVAAKLENLGAAVYIREAERGWLGRLLDDPGTLRITKVLGGDRFTDTGVNELEKALSKCEISR